MTAESLKEGIRIQSELVEHRNNLAYYRNNMLKIKKPRKIFGWI